MSQPSRRWSLVALVALFAALSMLMMTGACIASRRETEAVRDQCYQELHAIATLKVGQIVAWRAERLADARSGAAHLAHRAVFAQWLARPRDDANRESILQDLSLLRDAYGYRTLALLRTDGRVLLSLDPRVGEADAEVKALADRALQANEAVMGDIAREPEGGGLRLDIIAPVQGPQHPLAVLLLRVDPATQLFPLVQSWPTPSATAETDLVRREGDQVRFLNRLRHAQDAPLALSFPVARQHLPAAQAVTGRSGAFLGRDYRGVEVLADLHPVAGSAWFLVAKIDMQEVMAEAHYRNGVIQAFAALGILLCAMLLGLLFYVGEAKLYHGLFQATRLAGRPKAGPDAFTVQQLKRWAMLLGLLVLASGLLVLLGWTLELPILMGTLPGFGTTKPNTALGMMLVGAALACLASPRACIGAARTCAVLVLLLGGLTLVEHLSGVDFHIDQILFRAPEGMFGALAPGRMAPITALNFCLTGCALLLAGFRRTTVASQWLALPVGFIALAALLGHLQGPFGDYGLGRYFQMTFPAVVASAAAALGLLFLESGGGPMHRLATRSMGGWMLRHMLPLLVGMPLLVAWLGAAVQRRGWLEPSGTAALATVAFVALLLAAAWWAARSLDRLDGIRDQAEADLRESRSKLHLLLDSTAEAIYGIDLGGACTFCNRAFLQVMGYQGAEEVLGRNMHDLIHHSRRDGTAFPVEACRIFQAFREGKGTHVDDEVLWRADGTPFDAEYWSFPQFHEGRVVGAVVTFVDITLRSRAQEELRASRERLSLVLDTIPQSVFWKDGEGRFLGCNKAFAIQLGVGDPASIVGKTDLDLSVPREEAEAYRADDLEVMASSRPKLHIVEPLQKTDGTRLWVETSKVPLPDADGRSTGVLGIYEDITERVRLDEALKSSEAWHRTILETAMDGCVVLDQAGRILQANAAYAHMTGYPVAELLRMSIYDLKETAAADATTAHLELIRVQGRHRFETRHRCKDGHVIELEASVQVAPGSEGLLVAFLRDITERKRMEEAVKASEAWYRAILRTAMDGFMVVDGAEGHEGRILEVNEAYTRMVGYSSEELTRMRVAEVEAPESRTHADTRLQTLLDHGQHRFETRHHRRDGGCVDLEVSIQVVPGDDVKLVVFLHDITERKRAEAAILASQAHLGEAQALAHLGNWELDLPSGTLSWSEEIYRIFGIDPLRFGASYEAFLAAVHPEDRQAVDRTFRESVANRSSYRVMHRLLMPDGTIKHVDERGQTLCDAGGAPLRTVGTVQDITDLKLAEERIRASEARLAEAQAQAHLGSWDMDLRTRTLLWSDEFFHVLGLDPARDEATLEVFLRTVHPEDRDEVERSFFGSIAERLPYHMTHRLRLADGTVKFVDVRGVATYDVDGTPLHAMGTMLDITDLKKAEASMRESEERLRVLSDNLAGGMVYQVDSGEDGSSRRFTYISAGVQRLHGVTPAQAMQDAMVIYSQVYEEDQAPLARQEAAAVAAMTPFSAEYRVRHPAGGIRWLLACSSPRRLADNHLIWDGVELDITERKLAESQLLAQTELLRLTGRMAQVGGMEFDPETLEGTWTEEMARIHDLGYHVRIDAETALGHYPEEGRARILQAVKEASGSGKPFDLELEMTSAKGIRKLVHIFGDRAQYEGRKAILAIVQDITQKKEAESELRRLLEVADRSRRSLLSLLEDQRAAESEIRRLNADLEQRVQARTLELAAANKDLEAFAYSVSHDLRAPLRHMDGFLGMLARHLGDRLDDKGTHFLKVAQGAAVRMGQLVDGLLSFSRLGRAELHMVEVDAGKLVAMVIDEMTAECGDRKIRWQVGCLPVLDGDPTLLRLVFQNLIHNALKFTRNRPETVIEIQPIEGLDRESGILIRDNGVGFDPAYGHKLFGVFHRLHREDEFEGTGIGLANVHRIVTRHNGRVWAEGRLGEGATFFLAFPMKGASQ